MTSDLSCSARILGQLATLAEIPIIMRPGSTHAMHADAVAAWLHLCTHAAEESAEALRKQDCQVVVHAILALTRRMLDLGARAAAGPAGLLEDTIQAVGELMDHALDMEVLLVLGTTSCCPSASCQCPLGSSGRSRAS